MPALNFEFPLLQEVHTPSTSPCSEQECVLNASNMCAIPREVAMDKLRAVLADRVAREERVVARDKQVGDDGNSPTVKFIL
jgi:hypothetical protein